ncbi:917_t:CDS:2 [Acaulospora colombiana]|uniref:917_t:CDS:1 n=1 Tax=Acaulospora colombiana TaxID=27376 RepID=A0ACA9LNC3_9GLOM|nr:917_t:CDS:2 [Acaulospora colombiana]
MKFHLIDPIISERPLTTRVSTTNISVIHNSALPCESQGEPVVTKHETISGNHTTHFQKSTHRVEHINRQEKNLPLTLTHMQEQTSNSAYVVAPSNNRRPLLQHRVEKVKIQHSPAKGRHKIQKKQQAKRSEPSKSSKKRSSMSSKKRTQDSSDDEDEDSYSEDEFDIETADQELLKTVKKALLDYIEVKPSKKLKSGELTWTEFKPYMENLHLPQFKAYLKEGGIDAPGKMKRT